MARMPVTAWGQSSRIEQQYNRALQQLRKLIIRELNGATTTQDISRRLLAIQNSPKFIDFAEKMSTNMARQVYRESGIQWRKLAREASRRKGDVILNALNNELANTPMGGIIQDIIINNSDLIKTIPDRLEAQKASIMAKESVISGMRPEQLKKGILQKFDNLLEFEARRIARTETAKAQFALTEARAKSLGINWYIWRTVQDGMRVRKSHRHMEGVLVNFDEPPNPEMLIGIESDNGAYHAGNIYNCRCWSEPIIDFDFVKWPCKVYINGAIQTLTRKQFNQMALQLTG